MTNKCDLCEYGKKSTKFFLNLEEFTTPKYEQKYKVEVTNQKEVHDELFDFYENLFKSNKRKPKHDIAQFLGSIQITRLTEEYAWCEVSISEDEFLIATLKIIPKNKSPGNDG